MFFVLARAVFNDDAKIAVSSLLSLSNVLKVVGSIFLFVSSIISNQKCDSSDSSKTIFNLEINSAEDLPLKEAL